MSPRSEEFIAEAQGRVGAARAALAAGFPPGALSLAYYAMLYAARAALSEEDRYAKTHKGTWHHFRESFVDTDRFPRELYELAERTQPLRHGADYDALAVTSDQGETVVALAERFVAAVESMLD